MNSLFNIYCIGEVAKDKVKDELDIEVYVAEIIPNHKGMLDKKDIKVSISKDYKEDIKTTIVNRTHTIKARWFPLSDPNRVTPPDVCKGEKVLLYSFAGIDEYLWTTFQSIPSYRKLEKAVWIFSAIPFMMGKNTIKDCYSLSIDTYDKQVHFRTSTKNGEYTTYDMQYDTKVGVFTWIDGKKNEIQVQSFRDRYNLSIRKDADILIDRDTTYYNGRNYRFHNGNNITIKNGLKVIDLSGGTNHRCENSKAIPVIPGKGIIDIENGKHINVLNHKNINVKNIRHVTVDVLGRTDITTMGITIGSMGDELYQWLNDLCLALIAETHIGNLGAPTPQTAASIAAYTLLMTRINIMRVGLGFDKTV